MSAADHIQTSAPNSPKRPPQPTLNDVRSVLGLAGTDPTKILASAPAPLWTPTDQPWMQGTAPYTCNVPQVSFLEAAHPMDEPDAFRVYFGGADAVIGTAVVKISRGACDPPPPDA